jgi:hypothetical protein
MYLNVPLIIVITKADCIGHSTGASAKNKAQAKKRNNSYGAPAPEVVPVDTTESASALNRLVESIQQVLAGPQRTAATISTDAELVHLLQRSADPAASTTEKAVVPIFTVSNVTGEGLQLLRSYLFQLPTHAKSRLALQLQSTCVRILGSIGNTEEREEVVFPRDEELYSVKREVRHSTNRHALGSARENQNQVEDAGAALAAGMRCHSSSEDNLTTHSNAAAFKTSTPPQAAAIKRPNSSPDLPASASAGKASAPMTSREFAEFVEFTSTSAETGLQERRPSTPPASSRTKVLIGSVDSGKIAVGEPMLFGPTSTGEFISVRFTLILFIIS